MNNHLTKHLPLKSLSKYAAWSHTGEYSQQNWGHQPSWKSEYLHNVCFLKIVLY